MKMRAIIFGLLALFAAVSGAMTEKAFAEPFLPKGVWVSPGSNFSLTFKLEEGKVLFCEKGQPVVQQNVIIRQSEHSLVYAAKRYSEGNRKAGVSLTRLNDDAMIAAAGCIGGFLLVRKDAGLVFSDTPPSTGRFGFPEEDGTFDGWIDFDKGMFVRNGEEEPLKMSKSPNKGMTRLEVDGKACDVRLLGDAILAVYMVDEKSDESLPPFGLVAIP